MKGLVLTWIKSNLLARNGCEGEENYNPLGRTLVCDGSIGLARPWTSGTCSTTSTMLLTLTTTYSPATDLGYLLHKNPSRPQTFDLSVGRALVFYPEAQPDRCTAALLLDI